MSGEKNSSPISHDSCSKPVIVLWWIPEADVLVVLISSDGLSLTPLSLQRNWIISLHSKKAQCSIFLWMWKSGKKTYQLELKSQLASFRIPKELVPSHSGLSVWVSDKSWICWSSNNKSLRKWSRSMSLQKFQYLVYTANESNIQ